LLTFFQGKDLKISESADNHRSLSALGLFVSLHATVLWRSSSTSDDNEEAGWIPAKPQGKGKGKGGKGGGSHKENEDIIDEYISTMENIIKIIPSSSRGYVLLSLLLSIYSPLLSSNKSFVLLPQSVVSARLLQGQFFSTIFPSIALLKDGTKNPQRVDSIFALTLLFVLVSSSLTGSSSFIVTEKERDGVYRTISSTVLATSHIFHLTPSASPVPLADGLLHSYFIIALLCSPSFGTYLSKGGAFNTPPPLVCILLFHN
jgi:hypothetical protein